MKLLLIILSIFVSNVCLSQTTIYYVLNSDGKEVAKRIQFSKRVTWNVSDSTATIEALYTEKERLEIKYQLAIAILKLLDVNGNAVDKRKYNEAVTAFNNFKK